MNQSNNPALTREDWSRARAEVHARILRGVRNAALVASALAIFLTVGHTVGTWLSAVVPALDPGQSATPQGTALLRVVLGVTFVAIAGIVVLTPVLTCLTYVERVRQRAEELHRERHGLAGEQSHATRSAA